MSAYEIKRKDKKIFCPLINTWHVETPEEKVRQEYIRCLVRDYGYSFDQMAQEVSVSNSSRGQGMARADIVIWRTAEEKREDRAAFLVVECKAENVRIREEDYYQGHNYASWAGASFFVTTNEKETKYFNVDKSYLPKKLIEVVAIPTAEEALVDKKVKEILEKTKVFTRDDFSKMLRTCHNIIRNNDKLSPEAAFDEISKILFMKIAYEREQRGTKVFTKDEFLEKEKWFEKDIRPNLKGTPKDLPYMQFLFYNTKDAFKNDQLFEENELIKIRQNSFEQILGKLESYNLSDTQDDVKGIAFERFLGTTFRGELGQYFTPRTIVDFMTYVLDPREGEVICDPTCGSGGFLIKAFEYVREQIEEDIKQVKAELRAQLEGDHYETLTEEERLAISERVKWMQDKLNQELDTQVEGSRMYRLSHDCIFGTDANPRMARTSKMNMIMHGDGHSGVHHHDGLLNLNGIFEERFDVILTNPPFGSRIDKSQKITEADRFTDPVLIKKYTDQYGKVYVDALNQVNKHIGDSLLSLYDVGAMTALTEVLFMERCLRLLKKGGRMGMVLPEGVLNTSNLQKVREYFEGKAKIILICSIPQDVFIAAGATVKPSLVFFKRFTEEEETAYSEAKEKAEGEVRQRYAEELKALEEKICEAETRALRSAYQKEADNLEKRIVEEARPLLKEYTIFFDQSRPLILVEGEGDVKYIQKAIEVLAKENGKYELLKNVDMIHCGGAANMKHTIQELRECLPAQKKVIVVFDRDEAGGAALKDLTGKGKDRIDTKTYHCGQFYYFKLPVTDDCESDIFVIEDYFSNERKREIAQAKLDSLDGSFNGFPKDLKQLIKEQLARDLGSCTPEMMRGFEVLLDKLCKIIKDEEHLTEVQVNR